jgi:hypothetical protein
MYRETKNVTDRAVVDPWWAGRRPTATAAEGRDLPAIRERPPSSRVAALTRPASRWLSVSQAGLEVADDCPSEARCEEAWTERPGPILTDRRQLPQSGPDQ